MQSEIINNKKLSYENDFLMLWHRRNVLQAQTLNIHKRRFGRKIAFKDFDYMNITSESDTQEISVEHGM